MRTLINFRDLLQKVFDFDEDDEDISEYINIIDNALVTFDAYLSATDADLKDYYALFSTGETIPWGKMIFFRSAEKIPSRILIDYFKYHGDDATALQTSIYEVSKLCYRKNRYKWVTLCKALFADYEPINNYNVTETTTHGHVITDTPRAVREVETTTNTDTSSVTSGNVERQVSAFDSDDYQNAEKNINNDLTTRVTGDADANVVVSTETGVDGEDTTTHSGTDTKTKAGNIGTESYNKMITDEVLMRKANDFLEIILQDLDSMLFLGVY